MRSVSSGQASYNISVLDAGSYLRLEIPFPEDTVSVTGICDYFSKNYPVLDRDLLLTAAMCHDIGKVRELSSFPKNDYTDEGQLIGHIVIGSDMVISSRLIGMTPILFSFTFSDIRIEKTPRFL